MTISKRRAFGLISLGTGVLFVGAGLFVSPAGADPVFDESQWDAHLQESHHGVTNSEFANQQDDCPRGEGQEDAFVWHFVAPANDTFVTLNLAFEDAGTLLDVDFVADPDASHAYVYTATDDTVLDGVADLANNGDNFVLSHVCAGTETTTTTEEETTTTVEDTTTTVEDTTTSVSVEDRVITTTTVEVGGVVQERPDTLPRTGFGTLPLLQLGVGMVLTGLGTLRYRKGARIED